MKKNVTLYAITSILLTASSINFCSQTVDDIFVFPASGSNSRDNSPSKLSRSQEIIPENKNSESEKENLRSRIKSSLSSSPHQTPPSTPRILTQDVAQLLAQIEQTKNEIDTEKEKQRERIRKNCRHIEEQYGESDAALAGVQSLRENFSTPSSPRSPSPVHSSRESSRSASPTPDTQPSTPRPLSQPGEQENITINIIGADGNTYQTDSLSITPPKANSPREGSSPRRISSNENLKKDQNPAQPDLPKITPTNTQTFFQRHPLFTTLMGISGVAGLIALIFYIKHHSTVSLDTSTAQR